MYVLFTIPLYTNRYLIMLALFIDKSFNCLSFTVNLTEMISLDSRISHKLQAQRHGN